MLEKLKSIDSFGVGIGLNYNRTRTHKTFVGTTFTILFAIAGLYNIISLGFQLLGYKDPKVVHTRIFQSDPERIELNEHSFEFTFGLQSQPSFLYFIDETVYKVQASYYYQKREIQPDGQEVYDIKRSNLTLVPCHTLNYHIGKKFDGIATKNTYCIDYSKHESIFLQGTWESPIYGALDLKFYMCQNTTNVTNCKPQDEIDRILEGSFFQMVFSDLELDLNNVKNPEKNFRNVYWDQLSPKNYRDNYLYLKNVKVNTDTGLIDDQIEHKKLAGFDHAISTFSNLALKEGNFFNLRFKIEPQQDIYDRNYIKMSGFLAQVAALLKTYLIIIFVIVNPLQRFQLYRQFIGECCTIDKNSFDVIMPIIAKTKKQRQINDDLNIKLTTKKDIVHDDHDHDLATSQQEIKRGTKKKYSASLDFKQQPMPFIEEKISTREKPIQRLPQRPKSTFIPYTNKNQDEVYNLVSSGPVQTESSVSEQIKFDIPKRSSSRSSEKEEEEREMDQTKEIDIQQQIPIIELQDQIKQNPQKQNIESINIEQDEDSLGASESFDPKNIQDLPRFKNFSFVATPSVIKDNDDPMSSQKKKSQQKRKVATILTKLKNSFEPQNLKEVKMTVSEFILSWFVTDPKKEIAQKKILYEAGQNCVTDLLDVRNLLVMRNEVELLKLLLIEKQDQELFESVAKQKINIIEKVDLLKR